MILVDTCIWVDHFHRGDAELTAFLESDRVMTHPHVIGELALGTLRNRSVILQTLADLPQTLVAREEEVMAMIDRHKLQNIGIGYTDAHLLAAAKLTSVRLWTRDKRLQHASEKLGLAHRL